MSGNTSGRKKNFTDGEKFRLCEEYEKYFCVLTSKFSVTVSNRKKHDAWWNITDAMNKRNPCCVRSDKDFQKKWQNLCSIMKDEYGLYRKELTKTGGGPAPAEPTLISQKVAAILGEDDPTVHGIEGGIDSSRKDAGCSDQAKSHAATLTQDDPSTSAISISPTSPSINNEGVTRFTTTRRLNPPATLPFNICPPLPEETEKRNKRKCDDAAAEVTELHKDLLVLEKTRATLEIEKLQLEKNKLSLEIEVLQLKKQKLAYGQFMPTNYGSNQVPHSDYNHANAEIQS